MSWRHTKIGKVHPNLPFYKKFTQECWHYHWNTWS